MDQIKYLHILTMLLVALVVSRMKLEMRLFWMEVDGGQYDNM